MTWSFEHKEKLRRKGDVQGPTRKRYTDKSER